MSATLERGPILPAENELATIKEIERLLEAAQQGEASLPTLTGPEGEAVTLPESLFRVLRQVVHQMAQERAVVVLSVNKDLTTQEAADILHVSRPFLIKLLEEGQIPYVLTGTHRRIHFHDLMAYKTRRDAERRKALAELTRLGQEMGLYDE